MAMRMSLEANRLRMVRMRLMVKIRMIVLRARILQI